MANSRLCRVQDYSKGKLDLVVAGTENGIMMVEAGANEVCEDEVVDAITWAQEAMQPAVALPEELVKKVGVEKLEQYEVVIPKEELSMQLRVGLKAEWASNFVCQCRAP